MQLSTPSVTAPVYSAIAGAISGLVLWVLQAYAFPNHSVPAPIQTAVLIIIPAACAGVASLVTRRSTTTAAIPPNSAPPAPPKAPAAG
jgi:hypothetical protein